MWPFCTLLQYFNKKIALQLGKLISLHFFNFRNTTKTVREYYQEHWASLVLMIYSLFAWYSLRILCKHGFYLSFFTAASSKNIHKSVHWVRKTLQVAFHDNFRYCKQYAYMKKSSKLWGLLKPYYSKRCLPEMYFMFSLSIHDIWYFMHFTSQ